MLIKDNEEKLHVFDAKETLLAIAKYVWEEPSLAGYRILPGEKVSETKDAIFVDLTRKKTQRLREFSEILNDNYYESV